MSRKIKWALTGFVAGVIFCYVLVALFQPQRSPSSATTVPKAATLSIIWPAVTLAQPPVGVTELRSAELHIDSPVRFDSSKLEPRPWSPPPGYSLDLIDDIHHESPELQPRK